MVRISVAILAIFQFGCAASFTEHDDESLHLLQAKVDHSKSSVRQTKKQVNTAKCWVRRACTTDEVNKKATKEADRKAKKAKKAKKDLLLPPLPPPLPPPPAMDKLSTWYCVAHLYHVRDSSDIVVSQRGEVYGSYSSLQPAKDVLNQRQGTDKQRQMICEMTADGVQDPHRVGDENGNQGGGAAKGFNKWWSGWEDIRHMQKLCTDDMSCRSPPPPPPPPPAAMDKLSTWYCVAHLYHVRDSRGIITSQRGEVYGSYSSLQPAKDVLNQRQGTDKQRQMICEMTADGAKDPHGVGDENGKQSGGAEKGFNKWWSGGEDIRHMMKLCNDDTSCRNPLPPLEPLNAPVRAIPGQGPTNKWYCVVHGNDPDPLADQSATNKVVAVSSSLEKAKDAQRDVIWGRSQMICEMTEEGAKKDPHNINGQKQGDASGKNDDNDLTFKKFWHDWHDIGRMNALCEADTRCRYNSATIEKVLALYAPAGGRYTPEEAAKRCSAEGLKHCLKEDITGTEHCSVGWASDAKGYWMGKKVKGCGSRLGWIDYGKVGTAKFAWCCHVQSP